MDAYSSLKKDGQLILFVNSKEPPHEEIPLNHYYYKQDGDKTHFCRLYRIVYRQDKDGFSVDHSLYDWQSIQVKSHCVAAMKQFIDSLKSAEEFLK